MPDDLDQLVDELYALPLERFVPERDVLVKQLRAAERRAEATEIAALVKPSVVAWAVNQIVRAQRDAAARLWDAGDEVLDVQRRLVDGDAKGPELRAAIDAERAALTPLTDAARGLMTATGKFLSDANVTAVAETLHAAAIDPGARPDVAAGRLSRPLRLTGLEAALATGAAPRTPGRRAPQPTKAEQLAIRDADDERQEAERRRLAREERARRQAAEQALLRAERERDLARERIGEAVSERDAAAHALAQAQERLDRAEHDLAAAHERLEHAEDAVEAARQEVQP